MGADINWCWAGRCGGGRYTQVPSMAAARMMRASYGDVDPETGEGSNITQKPSPVGWGLGYSNCRLVPVVVAVGVNDLSLLHENGPGGLKVVQAQLPMGTTYQRRLDGRRLLI